jgi:biuret amidohydrolase
MSTPKDYIRDFMSDPIIDAKGAALVIIDMQYATGSRQGALGRTLKAQGSNIADYRFARIEQSVLPRTLELRAHFHRLGQPVIHVTLGAALPDASDAPRHMQKLLVSCNNYVGSADHEILHALTPVAGEHVVRKTTVGAFASTSIDSLLRSLHVDQIYMVGVSTNMCVEAQRVKQQIEAIKSL